MLVRVGEGELAVAENDDVTEESQESSTKRQARVDWEPKNRNESVQK